jgi:sporulation protein YlmC with PRC-barrel domain
MRIAHHSRENHMAERRKLLSASTLSGDKVFNLAGEDLGKIEDFMLDMESGRIAYAVLSFGGVLGVGDKLFAVPPEALTLDEDKRCFMLDASKEDLARAPGFQKENWPDVSEQSFRAQVYSYYGRTPSWS